MAKAKRVSREKRAEELNKYALWMWSNVCVGLRKREIPRSKASDWYLDRVVDAVVALYDWTTHGCPEDETERL